MKFEYLCITEPRRAVEARLNYLGKQGWELVSAFGGAGEVICVLKRRLPTP